MSLQGFDPASEMQKAMNSRHLMFFVSAVRFVTEPCVQVLSMTVFFSIVSLRKSKHFGALSILAAKVAACTRGN